MTMVQSQVVEGFSKMSKAQKIDWLVSNYFEGEASIKQQIESFWHDEESLQSVLDGFSENVISNHYLPFSIAPNFLIDGHLMSLPMVIEESSVVAAASSAAKFWLSRGGFKTEILSTIKLGHVHFTWTGTMEMLKSKEAIIFEYLNREVNSIVANMEKRGGGIQSLRFKDFTDELGDVFQLEA